MPKPVPPHGYDSQGRPIWAKNANGQPVCGRKIRGKDAVCQQTIRMANGRCENPSHGGRAPGRPITTGKRSRLWEALGIGAHAKDIAEDPEITSHRRNIELIEGLMRGVAEDVGPTLAIWQEARDLYVKAVQKGDTVALVSLGKLLEDGWSRSRQYEQVVSLAEQQRRHIESEIDREETLAQSLTQRQAKSLVSTMLMAVMEEVTDTNVRRRIGERLARLLGRSADRSSLPGSGPI